MGKIKIQVENPCLVDKEKLSKREGGYLCAQCHKCVVDYTSFPDQLLYEKIVEKKGQEFCGIFRPEQLSKVYQNKKNTPIGIFSSLLLSGLLLTTKNAFAQNEVGEDTSLVDKNQMRDSVNVEAESAADTSHVLQQSHLPIIPDNALVLISEEESRKIIHEVSIEFVTLGFATIEPVPTPFQNFLDTVGNKFSIFLMSFGKKEPTSKPPSGNSGNNTDRPAWIESLRSRFRKRKKN